MPVFLSLNFFLQSYRVQMILHNKNDLHPNIYADLKKQQKHLWKSFIFLSSELAICLSGCILYIPQVSFTYGIMFSIKMPALCIEMQRGGQNRKCLCVWLFVWLSGGCEGEERKRKIVIDFIHALNFSSPWQWSGRPEC